MATTQTDELIEELSRPVIKLVVALFALYFIRFIVGFLPGLGSLHVPLTGISLRAIAIAVITAIMVAFLVKFALEIEPKLESILTGPDEIVADLVDIVKYLLFLLAIVLAYSGFAGVAYGLPLIGLLYDFGFFVLAVIPTILIALKLFQNLDEITDLLTAEVKDAAVDDVTCPSCQEDVRASQDFCPHCGEDVTDAESAGEGAATSATCPECDAKVDDGMEFCGSCGTELSDG